MPSVSALVMVGMPVSQSVGPLANFLAVRPGGVEHSVGRHPWVEASLPFGYSPFVKSGIVWSQYLYFARGIAAAHCGRRGIFIKVMPDITDIDRTRLRQKAVQQIGAFGRLHLDRETEILVACSPICGIAATGGPAWSNVTSLDVLRPDQGKPLKPPEPAAKPAPANAPAITRRRVVLGPVLIVIPFAG